MGVALETARRYFHREGSPLWHSYANCRFESPGASDAVYADKLPPGIELCAWCASRGSGVTELDASAALVLVELRRDAHARDGALHALAIEWAGQRAGFVFSTRGRNATLAVEPETLRAETPSRIAQNLLERIRRELSLPRN